MRPSPRRRLLVPLLGAALVVTTGCSTGADPRRTGEALRVVGPFEVHSLDPAIDGEVFTRLQVAETLVTSDLDGELTAGLATEWSSSRGGRIWEFEIADDVTYHDGTPASPDTIVASLERAADEAASPLAGAPVADIRAEDSSVVVELARPYLTLPAVLTHYSTAILAPGSYAEDGHVTEVLGTGPYEVTSVELPASIETTRFEDYRGEAPEVGQVTFQAVGRPESRALMAVSDQADVVFGLEPAGRERVASADDVTLETSLQPRTVLLKVNADHPTLGDVRVRRALSLALDREAMAGAVLREQELAATRLLPPSLAGWQSEGTEPLEHDADEAARLLDEAGWRTGTDGIRVKDGEPLRLTLVTYPDRAELPALATAIQAALREVGVELAVTVTNSSEIPAGQADGSLELALIAKHFALVSDPLIDVAEVFAPAGSDWGVMGWNDPRVDRAVEGLLAGATGTEATRHRQTIVETAQEELPLIPVSWYRMNAAVSDRVEGFRMDPLETSWHLADLEWTA